jgi:hypothetical protein
MKKILTLVLIAFLGGSVMAQEAPSVAKIQNAEKFAASKVNGIYVFQMPSSVTSEQIKKSASYYTQYFTVDFDAKSHDAKINMLKNDDVSKHVIVRFLVANGIKEINMTGKNYEVDAFFQDYIR